MKTEEYMKNRLAFVSTYVDYLIFRTAIIKQLIFISILNLTLNGIVLVNSVNAYF